MSVSFFLCSFLIQTDFDELYFMRMLFSLLDASLLEDSLTGKGVIRIDETLL